MSTEHWARVVAAVARATGELDLAEECAQEAYAQALEVWPRSGVPDNQGAWLTTVARNKAFDVLRRRAVLQTKLPLLVRDEPAADDRLELIFTCCHPALNPEARVALTLRLVCGLTTAEVARAFLVPETAMTARITRAKRKIATARIPYRVPEPDQLAERLAAVLDVVHLIFTTGHTAPVGDRLVRTDLTASAVTLARLLRLLMPTKPDVAALLSLLLLIDSRTPARLTADGRLALLEEQDRTLWNRALIREAGPLLTEALHRKPVSRYALQAAIAAVHADAARWEDTDWSEIVALYGLLLQRWPTPVVRLNHAVAVGLRDGPSAGLAALDPLLGDPALATYPYLAAARADFLRRAHRTAEAATAYEEALALTANEVERRFLADRLRQLPRG